MWLEAVNGWLAQPWMQAVVALILFFAGVLVTIAVYQKQRLRAGLAYHVGRKRLLGYSTQQLPTDVEFRFRGQLLKRLDKLQLMFWNSGNVTIAVEDRVPSDAFRLTGRFRIVDAKVTQVTRAVTNVQVAVSQTDDATAFISFDYLDPKDGAVIEVLCEGFDEEGDSKEKFYGVHGTFRGMPQGLIKSTVHVPRGWKEGFQLYFAVASVGALGVLMAKQAVEEWPNYLAMLVPAITAAICLLAVAGGLLVAMQTRRRHPRTLATKDLV